MVKCMWGRPVIYQRDNDEVDAYLLTYIYDKITQVFYKHKDNKE